jgi:hypothetical protein
VLAQEARSLRSDSDSKLRRNDSSDRRHATAIEGKFPHWFSGPKREEPSRRKLNAAR